MRRDVSDQRIREHVERLGEQHPPIPLSSVDRTVRNPTMLRRRLGHVLEYLARVELEVERNVWELLILLPNAREVDTLFYKDVWQRQEIRHGLIIDSLVRDLGMKPTEPMLEINFSKKVLGALSRIPAIGEVTRLLYYLTGASTERQAVLAYSHLHAEVTELGEGAIANTVIAPIKQQEPGHFAFYEMSARQMMQSGELRPWQLWLTRRIRSLSYGLVGTNGRKAHIADMGGVVESLGFSRDLEAFARGIGRLEADVLWANRNGMKFPPYVLRALRDCVDLYRERIERGEGVATV